LAASLPRQIADERARERLVRLAACAPGECYSIGVECRLASSIGSVDLGVAFLPHMTTGAFDAWLRFSNAACAAACWGAIEAFIGQWHDSASSLRAWIPFIFLEYDADSADTPVIVPSIFAALDSPIGVAPDRGLPEMRAAREFSRLLSGNSWSEKRDEQLCRCFRALRGQARVLHVAVMLSRSTQSWRVSVLLQRNSLESYLRSIGGTEAADTALLLATGRYEELLNDSLQLDIDIGPPISSRVGFNLQPDQKTSWSVLLQRSVELGLCSSEGASALLRWCSSGTVPHREISHLKLVGEPGRTPELKGYVRVVCEPHAKDR